MHVSEQGFFVKSYKKVNPVDVGPDFPIGGSYAIIAVLSFDVRVVFDVGKDM